MIDEEDEEGEKGRKVRKVLLYLQQCHPKMLRAGDVSSRRFLEEGMEERGEVACPREPS